MVVTKLVLSYNRLKLKLRVFLGGHRVAMVTYYAIMITIIGSKVAERLRDTNIVASLDNSVVFIRQSKAVRKVLDV